MKQCKGLEMKQDKASSSCTNDHEMAHLVVFRPCYTCKNVTKDPSRGKCRRSFIVIWRHEGCKAPLWYITEKKQKNKDKVFNSNEGEGKSLTAREIKLLCSRVIWQWILLYLSPDGSRVNILWLGWVLSVSILWALCRDFTHITAL